MLSKTEEYYSNGKLLITSEYLVLKGAKALALPVKFGQNIQIVLTNNNDIINFTTNVVDSEWLSCSFKSGDATFISSNNNPRSSFVNNILKEAYILNPEKFSPDTGMDIISNLNFDINWGLGSSSSFISNIAYIFDINPFDLHKRVSNGSGYDIACARATTPILYRLESNIPTINTINYFPDFHKNIYFVYTGRKMDSSKSVKKFLSENNDFDAEVEQISTLTNELINAGNLTDFNYIVKTHEQIISSILKEESIKDLFFKSFEGEIKSLGAWGGDFIMVSSELDLDTIVKYFKSKNLSVVIPFNKMIL